MNDLICYLPDYDISKILLFEKFINIIIIYHILLMLNNLGFYKRLKSETENLIYLHNKYFHSVRHLKG